MHEPDYQEGDPRQAAYFVIEKELQLVPWIRVGMLPVVTITIRRMDDSDEVFMDQLRQALEEEKEQGAIQNQHEKRPVAL